MATKKITKTKRVVKKNTTTRAKKSTAKKTSPKKKVITRKKTVNKSKKILFSAPTEKCFWVHNGPAVVNLQELKDVLCNTISDEQFIYHNDGRNDFAIWVEEVLGDASCAQALSRVKTRKGAVIVVAKFLKEYK